MVPRDTTIAVVREELNSVAGYVARHNWQYSWNEETLELIFSGCHPIDKCELDIIAKLEGYRALPPIWTFHSRNQETSSGTFFPQSGNITDGGGSIFHSNNLICAPFNRFAYKEHNGPHGDWGGPANWLSASANKGYARATKLADMFAIILTHLKYSPGMKK